MSMLILTAAHVVDEFASRGGLERIWIGSTLMVRSGDGHRPVALKRMKERYVVRDGPNPDDETVAPDIAWIGLTEADVRSIEAHGGVFFNLDSPRSRIPAEPDQGVPPGALPHCAVSVIVGMLGYNYRTGAGPNPVGGDVPLNLCMSMCGEPAFPGRPRRSSIPSTFESFNARMSTERSAIPSGVGSHQIRGRE